MANKRSLTEILASVSEFLFPAENGGKVVTIDSRAADGDTALHIMAWQNDVEGVQTLIDARADINALGDMGYTPLHVAVAQCNTSLVALLLQAGARFDLATELGGTARDKALQKGGQIAALFVQPGA